MILHIPHSSTNTLNYTLNNKDEELLRMTDHFTNDLYTCNETTRIEFDVSRLICDVERFEDDSQETMSKFGMGVCYTMNTEGEKLRDVTDTEKAYILEHHYRAHHQRLTHAVDEELRKTGKSLIVDCHSFPDKAYVFNKDYNQKRPDICIGTDEFHTPHILVQKTKEFFLKKGYVVAVNHPYSGTMVPIKHYKKTKDVSSIMIEVNRKLYMYENGEKSEHYDELKSELSTLLELLNTTHKDSKGA